MILVLAAVLGDVKHVHPFREGNGRTQLQYLALLAAAAGHPIDLQRLNPQTWIEASKQANMAEYGPMGTAIATALEPAKPRVTRRKRD